MSPSKEFYQNDGTEGLIDTWKVAEDSEDSNLFYCTLRFKTPDEKILFAVMETGLDAGTGKVLIPVKSPSKRALRSTRKEMVEQKQKFLKAVFTNELVLDSTLKSPKTIMQELLLIAIPDKKEIKPKKGFTYWGPLSQQIRPTAAPSNEINEFKLSFESTVEGFGFIVIERISEDDWRKKTKKPAYFSAAGLDVTLTKTLDHIGLGPISKKDYFKNIGEVKAKFQESKKTKTK